MRKERFQEEDFEGFVKELIDNNYLEGAEAGIAKQMLDKGYDSLSSKQQYVFNNAIEKYSKESCERCAQPIPWCEMMDALENGGYCNYCQHMMEKIEKE